MNKIVYFYISNKLDHEILNKITYKLKKIKKIEKKEEKDKTSYIVNTQNIDEKTLTKINKKIRQITKQNPKQIIVLSKEIKNKTLEIIEKEKLNIVKYENIVKIIQYYKNNKIIYLQFLKQIVDNFIKTNNRIPEEQSIYILKKQIYKQNINDFINIIDKYKTINIITQSAKKIYDINNNEDYEEYEDKIIFTSNKRKSLARAQYIINVDLENEEILEYCISRTATIFNISNYKIDKLKNFDGKIINNIEIYNNERIDNTNENILRYDIKDLYISNKILEGEIEKLIKNNKYNFIGNNGYV